MNTTFKKTHYDSYPGYRLHHTAGVEAGASTLGFLHYNKDYMLIYFLRGTGNIKVEGHRYDIAEGDIIILNPAELFHCTVSDQAYHERIVLYFNESLLDNFPYYTDALFQPFNSRKSGVGNLISVESVQKNRLDKQLEELLLLARTSDHTSAILSVCKVVELLAQIAQITASVEESFHDTLHENPLINEILRFLNQHFREDITISTVADAFGINKSYLSHLFKEQAGMSLWNYVILRRIQACNELIRKNHSIEDASYQAGFQNYSNFFRLYKKHTGITPLQFKKQLHSSR